MPVHSLISANAVCILLVLCLRQILWSAICSPDAQTQVVILRLMALPWSIYVWFLIYCQPQESIVTYFSFQHGLSHQIQPPCSSDLWMAFALLHLQQIWSLEQVRITTLWGINLLGACTSSISIVLASKDYQERPFGMASNSLKNSKGKN